MNLKLLVITLAIFFLSKSYSQSLQLSAEIRPRLEIRHGFKTLSQVNVDPAAFVSQRSRLNFAFKNEADKIKIGVSLQNIRVWGDVPTLASADINGLAIHESWAQVLLSKSFSLKLGRQEIIYDDHRIFGSVDWAQQGRSHDALLAKYKIDEQQKIDIGFALNAANESLFKQAYRINNYKAFQYIWYQASFKNVTLSILALNNGQTYDKLGGEQEVAYSQTIGPRLKFSQARWKADASFYYQGGKIGEKDLSAVYFGGNLSFDLDSTLSAGVGMEYLSGNDMDLEQGKLKSFTPLYGTNHKFNGLMDYFYVGNHVNSVGLIDYFLSLSYKKGNFTTGLKPHLFYSEGKIINSSGDDIDSKLGTEIDFSMGYKISGSITLKGGYSQMFGTASMEILKSGFVNETNNWGWLMLTFKPQILSEVKSK